MPKPDTRETFIAKARQKHGTKYDYSREHGIRLIEIRYDEDIAQRLSQELKV